MRIRRTCADPFAARAMEDGSIAGESCGSRATMASIALGSRVPCPLRGAAWGNSSALRSTADREPAGRNLTAS